MLRSAVALSDAGSKSSCASDMILSTYSPPCVVDATGSLDQHSVQATTPSCWLVEMEDAVDTPSVLHMNAVCDMSQGPCAV